MIALALAAALSAADLHIDPKASQPLAQVAADHAPGFCHYRIAANGAPLPDPACTPGAVNPTLTLSVLRDPRFLTGMVRDKLTSAADKRKVYAWYGVEPPKDNDGQNQTCELDHVIDLSAGGADSLANIFPQCQLPTDPLKPVGERWFKLKDRFAEHYMIRQVKSGAIDAAGLAALQKQIAEDWTQLPPPN